MGVGHPIKISRREHVSVQPPRHDPASDRELLLGDSQGVTPAILLRSGSPDGLGADGRCRRQQAIHHPEQSPKHEQTRLHVPFASYSSCASLSRRFPTRVAPTFHAGGPRHSSRASRVPGAAFWSI